MRARRGAVYLEVEVLDTLDAGQAVHTRWQATPPMRKPYQEFLTLRKGGAALVRNAFTEDAAIQHWIDDHQEMVRRLL
jgi:hypothetical protein